MKKIRIGHIGTKHDHSSGKMECILKYPELFDIVGVAEEDPAQRELLQNHPAYEGIPVLSEEQLLNAGCDAMLIEGHEYELPYAAKRCVERGIAVHIDKPAGKDLQAFKDTLCIAKQNKIPVQMAYMYRYNPAVQECIQLVREGELGKIHSITAIMNTGHTSEKRQWLQQFKGGIMYFLGCHMIDLVLQLQGTPSKITPYFKKSGVNGVDAVDMATVLFEYPEGISVIQSNSCEINGFGRRQLVVCGSKGTYEIHPLERPIVAKYTQDSYAEPFYDCHKVREIATVPAECRYDEMMLDFAAFVRGEKENPYSYEYELQLQKLILASCGYDVNFEETISLL